MLNKACEFIFSALYLNAIFWNLLQALWDIFVYIRWTKLKPTKLNPQNIQLEKIMHFKILKLITRFNVLEQKINFWTL